MANYVYDEGGSMAAYFIITFLALVLVPVTLSAVPTRRKEINGCQCQPCIEQRKRIAKLEQGSLFNPKLSKKSMFLIIGWSVFAFLCYKVAGAKVEGKVYDPFEILGISTGTPMKEIKSRFKKLSRQYHPDKVKVSVNETIEMIQDRFVQITKAYKSLTDETIRKNWEEHGHPDGRQETTMGIALPSWIIAGKNNIWILGLYGLAFGAGLPALVGNWWFGSRNRTKDGIHAQSAATFFKTLREDSGMDHVVSTLSTAYKWEHPVVKKQVALEKVLDELESQIKNIAGRRWDGMMDLVSAQDEGTRRALILLFSYFLRIPIPSLPLQKEQIEILRQAPVLLSALLNVASSRSWILPTISVMRLQAYFAQALPPSSGSGESRMRFSQLPGITAPEVALDGKLAPEAKDLDEFVHALETAEDPRVNEIKKVVKSWGRLDVVDVSFKVIGEKVVTPLAYVFLVVKLRILPPLVTQRTIETDDSKESIKLNEEKDYQFLTGSKDSEDIGDADNIAGYAHTPFWPGNRKPSWWLVIADEKNNRIVVPPMKITDLPISNGSGGERDYRSYKIQFQAPQQTGFLTWKMFLISDTYVGEEVSRNLVVKIEDPATLPPDDADDEISEPDEDTLAGQMAMMRGGKVKRIGEDEEESDDESGTDDDEDSGSSSDSD